ncbi:hypothetical protein [Dyella sp.]|uniref:hypothetical protein n=1 Tax=Dyella sp. TaxID=1869338 RepID=UPI003F81BA78
MHDAATQPAGTPAAGKVFAQLAHIAAHEVITLRELRQRAITDGVQNLGDLNRLLDVMVAERSRFIGQGFPDAASDALERATTERATREACHA